MRILYQPTLATPVDWIEIDSSAWVGMPAFTCHALCVQGVVFEGADLYAVEEIGAGVRVVVIHEDPGDWPVGQRWAREWFFTPYRRHPDPRFGGAITPEQAQVMYVEGSRLADFRSFYGDAADIRPFNALRRQGLRTMRGQWVTEAHHEAHRGARTVRGWREWTEGLDASELDARGHVKDQRAQGRYEIPKGTRTYYHNAVASADGPIAAPSFNNQLGLTPAGAANQTETNVNQNGALCWEATTVGPEPDASAWPTTGEYRAQLDAISVGADIAFGLLTAGNANGYFGRVDSTNATLLESIAQDQAAFIGAGLKLASITNPAWTPGSQSDRFQIAIAAFRTSGHGNQAITLQLGEADDFVDGPWPSAPAASADNAVFFGANF